MNKPFIDFYKTLEVSRQASQELIRVSYRKLAFRYHPDNFKEGNEARFLIIKEAHDTLTNETKKIDYDRLLKRRETPHEKPAGHVRANHDLSFVAAYVNKKKPWESRPGPAPTMQTHRNQTRCPACGGYGLLLDRFGGQKPCVTCYGSGRK